MSICRHCGYVFPSGPAAAGPPQGLTSELAQAPSARRFWPDWMKIIAPLLLVLVGPGLLTGLVLRNRHGASWEQAALGLPAPRSYDASFEDWMENWLWRPAQRSSAPAQLPAVMIRAANGTCLVNLSEDLPRGLLARLGAKTVALTKAGLDAAYRHQRGDPPVATVVLFANGRRRTQATFDGGKHPQLLAQFMDAFGQTLEYSSPEAMMADFRDRLERELR